MVETPITTYLFGNGLSLAFNPDHYALDAITRRVRDRLGSIQGPSGGTVLDDLERIAKALERDDIELDSTSNFEDIAGPIDRLANTMPDLVEIARLSTNQAAVQAIELLSEDLKALYHRVVGAVLEEVMTHPAGSQGWEPLDEVAKHLRDTVIREGDIDVFGLNYDALLDACLLREVEASNYAFGITDEFDGRYTFWLAPRSGGSVLGTLAWREDSYVPSDPTIYLSHLHGAGSWMGRGNSIYKARSLNDIRTHALFKGWTNGEAMQVLPVVVLGDQKQKVVNRWPFTDTYGRLLAATQRATRIVIAGYSFRDVPLNRVLRLGLEAKTEVIVISPSSEVPRSARRALGISESDRRMRCVRARLPEGLEEV